MSRVMRVAMLTSSLFLVLSFQVSASTYSKNTKLTLNMQENSIKEVLQRIESQTEFRFIYENERINLDKRVNVNVKNQTVEQILNYLFKNEGVNYSITERNLILINPVERQHKMNSAAVSQGQQEKGIKGKVTNAQGDPLAGVTVAVKGTTNGTVTDINGEYTLANTPEKGSLLFSFVGMKTKEVAIQGKSSINVSLEESAFGLQEVVAVGFGKMKKVNLTGAVASVNSKELESRPVQNATQMLQGIVPGLNITQNNGSLESRPTINVRGIATIGQGSTGTPLILIDGMEGDINALNPQDIENISVLKDVSSSSIYGSRAPFGVILVTTKKGKEGKTVINYNNTMRWNAPIGMPQMMDSYEFATFFNEASVNSGWGKFFSDERMQRIKDYRDGKIKTSTIPNSSSPNYWADGYGDGNANVDWYKAIYRPSAFSQEHNMSASGGNEKTQYYVSGNYLGMNGLMQFNRDLYDRYTSTVKVSSKITDYATLSVNNRWIREDYGRPSALTGGLYQDLARQGWPTSPLYDPNGYLLSSPSPALGLRDGGRDKTQNDWLYQQVQLTLEPIKGWKTFGELNYRTHNTFRHWDTQKTYNHDVNGNPYVYNSYTDVYEYGYRENYINTNLYSEYATQIGNGHNVKFLLGHQSEFGKYRDLSADRQGIMVASLPVENLTSGTDYNGKIVAPTVSGQYQSWSTEGYFGRVNYDYKGKYLLEGNLRYDGTSRYRSYMRWKWFPSVSAGWNVAREEFFKPFTDVVDNLKLRVSYGDLGNQNTSGWYPTYLTMPVGTANGSWLVNGAKPNTSSAPGIVSQAMTWERIKNWNVGTDLTMFNNKLSLTADYFVRKTLDMTGPAPELPQILGTGVPSANNTDLKTYGFELSVGWNDRLANGLGYSVRFNLSDSQTKILSYPNPTGTLDLYRTGQLTGEIWGYETIGIAKTKAEMDAHLATLPNGGQDAFGTQWEAGDIMYKDLNKDGKIDWGAWTAKDHGDAKIIGNSTPRFPFS
ncbi:MAG: TonB-dependent receptor, partial [Bacteroidota bacterium]|nr:TonB-dependent receptor [Bacteroidota bacterium]